MKREKIGIKLVKDNQTLEFDSLCSAARHLKCQPGQLTMYPTYKGHQITLLGTRHKRSELKQKVYVYATTGELLRTFDSIGLAAKHFKILPTTMHAAFTYKHPYRGKFIISRDPHLENTFDPLEYI